MNYKYFKNNNTNYKYERSAYSFFYCDSFYNGDGISF